MDLSTFTIASKSLERLESSSDCLSVWLFISTLLVVIGLVIEYRHDLMELLSKRPLDKKLLQTIVGGVLITVGVAGELIVQTLASGVEARLRSANHLIEAGLIKSAAKSEEKAKGFERDIARSNGAAASSNERAGKANERAANAAKQAGDAEMKAGNANKRAAVLEKDAAIQREKAALAERALLELQERLKGRHLAPWQRKTLTDFLKLGPPGKIVIAFIAVSDEARAFAEEIQDVLLKSGWTVTEFSPEINIGVPQSGLTLQVHKSEAPLWGELLQQGLKAIGFPAPAMIGTNVPEDRVRLFIGAKP